MTDDSILDPIPGPIPGLIPDPIIDRAADWHGQVTADTVDWDAFTRWLEADPRHARAYDAVALAQALVDEHAAGLAGAWAANDDAPDDARDAPKGTRSRLWIISGLAGLAAALVLAWLPGRTAHDAWQTGDHAQTIALADGTRIALAPHSRLTRDGDRMALTGDAVFAVPHRPERALAITAGELTISDIGTHFDLRNDAAIVRLSVDEGRLSVSGTRLTRPVTIGRGQALSFDSADAQILIAPAPAGSTGDWLHDQLSYRDAPLPLVAADIARYGPRPLRVDGALVHLHFSGTLRLGSGHDPAEDLARLMALDLGMSGHGAVLRAAHQGSGAADRSRGHVSD